MFRRIAPGDANELRSLRLTALQSDPEAFLSVYDLELEKTWEHWADLAWHAALSETEAIFVCELQESLVGMMGVSGLDHDRADLWGVYVDKGLRGQGLSRGLLQATLDWVHQKGFRQLYLEVNPQLPPAIGLYSSAGFKLLGETRHCCGGATAQAWRLEFA